MERYKITFLPDNKAIEVDKAVDILTAAIKVGIHIFSSCGGEGVCGRCKVIVREGEFHTEMTGRLSPAERKQGYVLACRTTCRGDLLVEIPSDSRIEDMAILTEEAKEARSAKLYTAGGEVVEPLVKIEERAFAKSPLSTKLYLELPEPTLQDNCSDLDRLYRQIRKVHNLPIMQMGLANIKRLGRILRESNWNLTATLGNRNKTTEIVLVESGDTSDRNFGIALDIGTTTIVAYLVNLSSSEVLGARAAYNPQGTFGEDVISRIIYAKELGGLERLHHAVIDIVNELIQILVNEKQLTLYDISGITAAGNSTMTHLLLKVDPTHIRREPYIPVANLFPVIRAAEAGIKVNPRALLFCLPGVSSYVGGDITAGVLTSGIDQADEISMLIDMGTNGEIVLGNKEWLVCCSTSAGPCFEGGGITCGVRAMKGAIQNVEYDRDKDIIKYETINGTLPKGICGSGLISGIGELFEKGIIDRAGRIKKGSSKLVREGDEGPEIVFADKSKTQTQRDIVIRETDIKNLLHSKGAIFTGADILLREVSLSFNDVSRIFISGGLGTALDIEKAITVGLLPDIPVERFVFIGNSSVSGAKMVLLSGEAMEEAEAIAGKMTYVELSVNSDFMNDYTASIFLPHTHLERFPSVKERISEQALNAGRNRA